jgi:hypothetical protein
MFMTNQQSAELAEPCIGPLYNPAALVSPQLASVFVPSLLVVRPIGHNQFDAALLEPLTERVRIVGPIGNHPLRFLSRTTFAPGHADFAERGFRKRNFIRRGTFQPNSQRSTFTVDQYHPLCALATLGFTDRSAPFLAGAKLPSRKLSSHFSRPCSSSAPRKVRQALSHTPCSSHRFSLRQQVEGEGNSVGRKRQAAPVCRIHKIPSRQARFAAHGRPRLSRRRFGTGNKGSINAHCSSVNSLCRFFMTEAHQLSRLTRKYLM